MCGKKNTIIMKYSSAAEMSWPTKASSPDLRKTCLCGTDCSKCHIIMIFSRFFSVKAKYRCKKWPFPLNVTHSKIRISGNISGTKEKIASFYIFSCFYMFSNKQKVQRQPRWPNWTQIWTSFKIRATIRAKPGLNKSIKSEINKWNKISPI